MGHFTFFSHNRFRISKDGIIAGIAKQIGRKQIFYMLMGNKFLDVPIR